MAPIDPDVYADRLRGMDIEQNQCEREVRRLKDELKEAEARQTRLKSEREAFVKEWGL